MSNPLKDCYDAIRAALLANADVKTLFLGGIDNRLARIPNYNIVATYGNDPDIEVPNSFDYPRARLVFKPTGERWAGENRGQEMQDTSDGSTLNVQYIIEVDTGHQLQGRLMDACWALWTMASNWDRDLRQVVKYNGSACVLYAEPTGMDVSELDTNKKDESRGTNQWAVVWALNVGFHFRTTDLQTIG